MTVTLATHYVCYTDVRAVQRSEDSCHVPPAIALAHWPPMTSITQRQRHWLTPR